MGAFIQPLVDSGYRAIGIDLPGHGETSKRRTNIFELANVLRDIAGQLGGIQAAVAHSMGGTVTAVAISEGLDLDAVTLIAPASNLNHAVEKFESMFSLPPKAVVGLRQRIERRFGRDVWDRLMIQRLAADFDVPALIVHDIDDTQIDVTDSKALVAAWPGARSLITTGLGHDKIARDPGVVEAATAHCRRRWNPQGKGSSQPRSHNSELIQGGPTMATKAGTLNGIDHYAKAQAAGHDLAEQRPWFAALRMWRRRRLNDWRSSTEVGRETGVRC